jgi:hypothetical protein
MLELVKSSMTGEALWRSDSAMFSATDITPKNGRHYPQHPRIAIDRSLSEPRSDYSSATP